MKAGFAPGVGHGFGFEVVRETLGTFRYNSIGSFVKGGAYRTYGWVDPAKDLVGIIFMQRTNGGAMWRMRSTASWRCPRRRLIAELHSAAVVGSLGRKNLVDIRTRPVRITRSLRGCAT